MSKNRNVRSTEQTTSTPRRNPARMRCLTHAFACQAPVASRSAARTVPAARAARNSANVARSPVSNAHPPVADSALTRSRSGHAPPVSGCQACRAPRVGEPGVCSFRTGTRGKPYCSPSSPINAIAAFTGPGLDSRGPASIRGKEPVVEAGAPRASDLRGRRSRGRKTIWSGTARRHRHEALPTEGDHSEGGRVIARHRTLNSWRALSRIAITWERSPEAFLDPDNRRHVASQREDGWRLDVRSRAGRHIVEHEREAGNRLGDGREVRDEPWLCGLVVVRGDHQYSIDPRGSGGLGALDGDGAAFEPTPANTRARPCAVSTTSRIKRRLLVGGEGHRLATRAARHEQPHPARRFPGVRRGRASGPRRLGRQR